MLVLIALLVLTLGAFAAGWTRYPFGVLLLIALIAARLLARRRRPGPWG